MSEIFFPVTGQKVVPLVRLNDNDEITSVQGRKSESLQQDLKMLIIRVVIGSFFKATVVQIEPDDCRCTRIKRE